MTHPQSEATSPAETTATVTGQLKRMTLEAVMIRADGTREDLGVISDSGDLTAPQTPAA